MKKPEPHVQNVVVDPKAQYAGFGNAAANMEAVHQLMGLLWIGNSTPADSARQTNAAMAQLLAIEPRDAIEGQIALQLVACHNASMEAFRRSMISSQTVEGRNMNLTHANKLSRTYATLLEALNRHRGKGQQKVTVEHVHVHAGGQAVVGNVETGGRVPSKTEGQPHEQQPPAIAHDTSATLLGEIETDAEPVPSARRSRA